MGISQTGEQKYRTARLYGVTPGLGSSTWWPYFAADLMPREFAIEHSRRGATTIIMDNQPPATGQSQPHACELPRSPPSEVACSCLFTHFADSQTAVSLTKA